jgi:hypothetical protein
MTDAGAAREARVPEREPAAGERRAPSAPAEAGIAGGVPAARGQLEADGLGPLLARAVAQRAADRAVDAADASAHAPAPGLLQRSPKAWTQADAAKTIAALTPGWGLTSRWPAVQLLVARYGQLPVGGLEQREAVLGDIEHAMARWKSNQRESTGLKTDLDLSKRAALDALATQIARERAEIAADKARAAERAAALKARPAAPPAVPPPAAPSAPQVAGAAVNPPVAPRPHVPRPAEPTRTGRVPDFQIGDSVPSHLGFWEERLERAYDRADAAGMADIETQLALMGIEHDYRLPSSLELAAPPHQSVHGDELGDPAVGAPKPLPNFGDAESRALDRYFGRKIRAAAAGSEAARRELDAELTDAGLEHRYIRDASGEGDPEAHLGVYAIGAVASIVGEPIPGFSPTENARTDGHFRRRIREAVRSGDEALMAAIDADLIDQGLEFRYVRGYGSPEHGQTRREPSDVGRYSAPDGLEALTNPAGGDQDRPRWGLSQPGAVDSFQPERIPGLSPQQSTRLDGHFARTIRTATRTQNLEAREKLMSDIDADLIRRGLEHRYVRWVSAAGEPISDPNELGATGQ